MKFSRFSALVVAITAGLLCGCAQKDESRAAAIALAEAIFPGELEFYAADFRTTHYDVTLAIRGDPIARITFQMDADPAACVTGSACEERLRRAYGIGMDRAETLRAIDRAFSSCGIPVLAQAEIGNPINPPPVEPIIELDLRNDNQVAELARLTPCLETYWAENARSGRIDTTRYLTLRILLQSGPGPSATPHPLSFESRVPAARELEPVFLLTVERGEIEISSDRLAFAAHYGALARQLPERFTAAARDYLGSHFDDAHVPDAPLVRDLRLDPERIDVVRGYVLACSRFQQGAGPCREDIAIAMRYDLGTGAFTDVWHTEIVRDDLGTFTLPALPGRAGPQYP